MNTEENASASARTDRGLIAFFRRIGRVFLRGPVLNWWSRRRGRLLENEYVRRFVAAQSAAAPQPAQSMPAPKTPLRRLAFIADCMWEMDNLVPELNRIAETRVLDLNAALQTAGNRPKEAVAQTVQEFLRSASWEPDCTFFYARPALLSESVFDSVRKRWSGPVIGMSLDDKHEFFDYRIFSAANDNYQDWAKYFDLNLSSSRAITDTYRRFGLAAYYLPGGFGRKPSALDPPSGAFKYPFSFVGSRKAERAAIIERLQQAGIFIELFGRGWKQSSWIESPELVFRQSQINLGVGFFTPHSAVTNLKARDFECPGAGACYLTTYNWELPECFDIGKEILCYRSVEELIEMYFYYSARPELCLQIARAAHRRCLAEHTWEQRLRGALRHLGFAV